MKWLTSVLAGLCLLTAGCWLFTKTPVVPTVPDGGFADASAGTTFVDCSDDAIHQAAINLLPTIETGLATGNLDAALVAAGVNLGAPFVMAEVACGIHYLISRITHSQEVAPDGLEAKKLVNGQAWLASHPVPVKP